MSPLKNAFLLRVFIIIITYYSWSANVQAVVKMENYMSLLPSGSNLSLLIDDMTDNKPIVDYHSEQLTLPASTQKIITALAAMLELGPEFRYLTTFESNSKISNGILHGDLIAHFRGDPTFSRSQLTYMIEQLKQQGIKKITGNLIIDTSVFSSHDKASGWSWNNLAHCYNAAPSAAILDRNCFNVSIKSADKQLGIAKVTVPSSIPVSVTSQIVTYTQRKDMKYCELDVTLYDNLHYQLSGCMLSYKHPVNLSFAIQNGNEYVGRVIKNSLNKMGIAFNGKIILQTSTMGKRNILAQNKSAPLPELLTIMLKQSDNLIADSLFRTLGNQYYKKPGTWRNGRDAVSAILLNKAGIKLNNAVIADGSGLSRDNLVSARLLLQILHYIAHNDNKLNMITMMPIAGQDGTLRYRKSFTRTALEGKLIAKTGSLKGVYNLAGFIITAKGHKIAFVQLLSGYSSENQQALNQFESALYQDIYSKN